MSLRVFTRCTLGLNTVFLLMLLLSFHAGLKAQHIVPKTGIAENGGSGFKITSFHLNRSYPTRERIQIVARTNVALWAGSFYALDKAWYSGFPRSSFHFFNDNNEWNQMDKAGHMWTNYHVSRLSTQMWKWTGMHENQAVVLGGLSAVAYGSIVEIQDGYSQEWGFSPGDMAANFTGAAAYVSQELGWHEQRIQVKISYSPHAYSNTLAARRNQLFGTMMEERILKDYNSQIYWASANVSSFFRHTRLPKWLNISIGYGSDGMLGGTENKWKDKSGTEYNMTDIPRTRKFYLSPDIDLTKIRTKSRFLKTFFYAANMIKFPAPALELNSRGRFMVHVLK